MAAKSLTDEKNKMPWNSLQNFYPFFNLSLTSSVFYSQCLIMAAHSLNTYNYINKWTETKFFPFVHLFPVSFTNTTSPLTFSMENNFGAVQYIKSIVLELIWHLFYHRHSQTKKVKTLYVLFSESKHSLGIIHGANVIMERGKWRVRL